MSRMMSASTESSTMDSSVPTEKSPSSLGIVQFGFHAKTSYDADEALLQTRSENVRPLPADKNRDIWKRPPPDFRYVMFDPSPPKRNTVNSMKPWLYGTIPGQREIVRRPKPEGLLPGIFDQRQKEPEIVTRFHIDRPFTAKKKFVRDGMYPSGEYDNPKPHDFRQAHIGRFPILFGMRPRHADSKRGGLSVETDPYESWVDARGGNTALPEEILSTNQYPPIKSLGLDEFQSNYDKDPYSIKFKSERLNHIHGLPFNPPERDLVPGRQMGHPLSGKKKWDSDLILNKTPWPQKSEAFSRHRRRHRQPYSAFLERVEQKLGYDWSKEQLEKALEQHVA